MEDRIARGPNFVYAREFVRQVHGDAVWARVLAALPEPAAEVWRGSLLASGVYPFSAFRAMAVALAAETGARGDREMARMYEHIADRSLSLIYKVFFRVTRPSFVIGNYPKLWARFFTEGTVEVPRAEREGATLVFTLPEVFLDWLPPACLGFSTRAVQMAGGTELTQRQTERSPLPDGNWRIVYDLRWSEP